MHLFPMKVLYLLRSGSHAGRSSAPLHGYDHQAADDRFARENEISFAFSHPLGFRLLPRLTPMHSQRLAVVEEGAAERYPHLKEVLGKPINWEVIRRQYDMMIKYATALKIGKADADAFAILTVFWATVVSGVCGW